MLRQIIRDMYVDPEILAELPEEQREMLFFKIRQEQVRQYYQREDEEMESEIRPSNIRKKRKVGILEDAEGQPWTWVFGESPGEITVEEKWENLFNKRMDDAIKAIIQEEYIEKMRKISAARKNENYLNIYADDKTKQNYGAYSKSEGFCDNQPTIPVFHKHSPRIQSPKSSPTCSPVMKRVEKNKSPCGSLEATPVFQKRSLYRISPKTSPANSPQMKRAEKNNIQQENVNGIRKISNTNRILLTSSTRIHADAVDYNKNNHNKLTVKFPPDVGSQDKAVLDWKDNSLKNGYEKRQEIISHYDSADKNPSEYDNVMSNEEWQSQLRRFKEADERRSAAARRASLECRRQSSLEPKRPNKFAKLRSKLSRLSSGSSTEKSSKYLPLPPVPKSAEHSPVTKRALTRKASKPLNRNELIQWFEETQLEVLRDEESKQFPGWFHGLITRSDAESLLRTKTAGYYLVRVSDKLWGYTLSYKDENRTKHFLIDASEEHCYRFLGNDHESHCSLKDLIEYHQEKSISYNGEKLRDWVGQINSKKPDFAELLTGITEFQ